MSRLSILSFIMHKHSKYEIHIALIKKKLRTLLNSGSSSTYQNQTTNTSKNPKHYTSKLGSTRTVARNPIIKLIS